MIHCSFCQKPSSDVRLIFAVDEENTDVGICDECLFLAVDILRSRDIEIPDTPQEVIEKHQRTWFGKLLKAKTPGEVNDAFDQVFDIVHEARKTGNLEPIDRLFRWVQKPEALEHLDLGILLGCLRLTATMKEHVETWPDLLLAIERELTRRGENSEKLLWGLMR